MAHARRISTTAQALFRVFVQPTIAAAPTTPRAASLMRPSTAPATFVPAFVPHSQRRTAVKKYRPPVERTTPYDEEIASIHINLVDEQGVFHAGERLVHVLARMDRVVNHLVQITTPQEGSEHPFPVCKIVSKSDLREQERAKAKQKAKKSIDELTKTIELNWAVSPNDLQHWLKRLREFLEEGRRVEVVMGPKKRGRKATAEEVQNVLQSVKETVAAVPGAKERTEPEGEVGAIMTLFFDGPKEAREERQKQIQEEKEKEKLAEKAANGEPNTPKVSRWKIKEEERRKQAEIDKIEQAEAERLKEARQWQRQGRDQGMRQERRASRDIFGQGHHGLRGAYGRY